ncbi:MAG: hypothetical protein SH850_27035 [Planctomycetaceae bacterium]|nr:hypothetical protein [Planctomycetaceae bacterium]
MQPAARCLALLLIGMLARSHSIGIAVLCAAEQTLLFVDDHDVLYRAGTRRELHPATRHPANPLLTGPTPRNQIGYCSVHRDAATGRYQLWYQLTAGGQIVCYAESTDGVTWSKPELDLIAIKGLPDRNVVLKSPEHYGASVVIDPAASDPARRYKMAYWSLPPIVGEPAHPKDDRGPDGGMCVAFSPDGIHWTKQPGPVLRGTYGRIQDPPLVGEKHPWGEINSVSDVIDASYDPLRQCFVVYAKAWIDAPDGRLFWKRAIVRTESQDFVKWSVPQLVMAPDEHDGVRPAAYPGTRQGVQLHGAPVFVRHGVYFALVQVADFETHGLQPIELAVSRDGLAWSRPFRDTPFLPTGASGTFDAGRIWSNATPVVLDDEIRFYYGAYGHPWKFGKGEYPWDSKTRVPKSGIGLATLPLDRFAGLRPIEKLGQITLRPRSLRGATGLALNADASAGAIRVELLNASGYRLPGFTKSDAVPITTDGLRQRVAWKNADLANVPPEDVMIRIHLDNAEVFALTLE